MSLNTPVFRDGEVNKSTTPRAKVAAPLPKTPKNYSSQVKAPAEVHSPLLCSNIYIFITVVKVSKMYFVYNYRYVLIE